MAVYVYGVTPAANQTTSGTPNTEVCNLALRQATRPFALTALSLQGKGAGLTALSGIAMFIRLWTTVGSGGTTDNPVPKSDRSPAAATTGASGTPTAGTVSGLYKLMVGCGAAGPGGWVARSQDAAIGVDGGSDELDGMSASGTASLNYNYSAEIEE